MNLPDFVLNGIFIASAQYKLHPVTQTRIMRKLFVIFCSLFALSSQAQKATNPKPYAATITEADLKKHLYIIAGKEMEGRETATEGQRKAAAYIENYFKSLKNLNSWESLSNYVAT